MPSALVEVVLQHPFAEMRLFKLNQPEKTLLNAFACIPLSGAKTHMSHAILVI